MSEEKRKGEAGEEPTSGRDEPKSAAERRSEARRAARERAAKEREAKEAGKKPAAKPKGRKPAPSPKERPVSKARERREQEAKRKRPSPARPRRRREPRKPRPRPEGPGPARLYALLAGALLSLLGVLGFFYDASFDTGADLASDDLAGILMVNGWRNVVYLVTGLAALAFAARRPRATALALGLAYLVYAVWGFIVTERDIGDILGFLPLSNEDNVFHLLLAVLGLGAALIDGPLPALPETVRKRLRPPKRKPRPKRQRPPRERPVAKKPADRPTAKKPAKRPARKPVAKYGKSSKDEDAEPSPSSRSSRSGSG